jgi:hypothetical protein
MKIHTQKGAALILAVLVLSFLTMLGGALLTSTTLDIWIADNFKTRMQSLYSAEGAVERGRELLRTDGPPAFPLNGNDGIGGYQVSLRNGVTADTFTLVGVAKVGNSRRTIEATVRKGAFPSDILDPRLKTVAGLERLAGSITANATDRWDGPTAIGNYGSATDFRVAVANGDCTFGPGTGYGLLLVRGDLTISGGFSWTGLIVVIGKGTVHWNADALGQIHGGLFTVATRDSAGQLLSTPGSMTFDNNDPAAVTQANTRFPYSVIAFREF